MFIEGFTVFFEQKYGKTTETHVWLEDCSVSALLLPEAQFSHGFLSLTWLSSGQARAQVSSCLALSTVRHTPVSSVP